MNPHYHPYSELSSPHPPSPDNNNYGSIAGVHHNGHGPPTMNQIEGQQQGFHSLNNNTLFKSCAGCGGKISERFFLHALERYWHNSCLKCSCCGAMLGDIGTSCFARSQMILCKQDYTKLFGSSGICTLCGLTIPANEFVMRTSSQLGGGNQQPNNQNQQNSIQHNVFHLKCFTCSKCGSNLRSGDRYYMLAGSIVCEQDFHKLIKSSSSNSGTPPVRKGKVGRPRRSRD